MNNLLNTFLFVFLGIFLLTAILTLASLPGWIKIPEGYRSKLSASLILEVIGCVIGFVWTGVRLAGKDSIPPITSAGLLQGEFGWHFAPRNWRTVAGFEKRDGGKYRYSARTYYTRMSTKEPGAENADTLMFTWLSEDFDPPPETAKELRFKCKLTVHKDGVAKGYGPDAPPPGESELTVTLRPVITWEGGYDSPEGGPGGIYLTRDTKR